MTVERQSSTRPPAQPSYILRGHASQIHSIQFVHQNTRLITGDADGWVIYWKLETKRALAVWKGHNGAILGTAEWGHDKIITHGRDNSLKIWQMRTSDESALSTTLPAEVTSADRPLPWLLHTLPVNTLNFCAFSMCYTHTQEKPAKDRVACSELEPEPREALASVLVAVPARDDKKAEVYQFPDERLKCVVPRAQSTDTGMVMAVKLVQQPTTQRTLVITGYEGGLTAVHLLPRDNGSAIGIAQLLYLSQPHKQPILSLDVMPDARTYFTSGADAIIAAHRIPELPLEGGVMSTQAAGVGLDIGPDVGPDVDPDVDPGVDPNVDPNASLPAQLSESESESESRIKSDIETASSNAKASSTDDAPPSTSENSTEPPLSFAKRPVSTSQTQPEQSARSPGGLTSLLSTAPSSHKVGQPSRPPPAPTVQTPYKVNNTKHAGQQSLSVRSDGRLIVTGGWDSRVRIYSTKTLREVAVLKWHKEGVYAAKFSEILEAGDLKHTSEEDCREVVRRETGLGKLQRQREEKMQIKHWVAAGAKDGKVSIWEVF